MENQKKNPATTWKIVSVVLALALIAVSCTWIFTAQSNQAAGSIRLIEPCGRERELRCCVGITRSEGRRQRALFSPVLLGG